MYLLSCDTIGAGSWHELAKFLPLLARKGVDALSIQEATGLERSTQNIWTVAAQVGSCC